MAKKDMLIQAEPLTRRKPEATLFERVQEFLVEQEWEFRSNEERGYFAFHLRLRDGSVKVIIDVSEIENWSRVMVYVIYPTVAPELKRTEVAEAIARINYTYLVGQLEIDLDDGEMRVRSIIESEGYLGDVLIERVLRRATDMAEEFQAPLLSIAFGNTKAKDVLALLGRDGQSSLQ